MWDSTAPGSDQTWGELRDIFLEDQTPNTRKSYAAALEQFFAQTPPDRVKQRDVAAYRDRLREEDRGAATVRAGIAALSSFFKFLMRQTGFSGDGVCERNPAAMVRCDRVSPYGRSRKMSVEQFRRILAVVPDTPQGRRDRAWLLWHALTARRRSEVYRMRWEDIERVGDSYFYRYVGKGQKSGRRILPEEVVVALRAWLGNELPTAGHIWQMTHDCGPSALKSYCSAAGIDTRSISTHSLRHLAALIMDESGADIKEVSQFLDHSSVATTQIYLEALNDNQDERSGDRARILLG